MAIKFINSKESLERFLFLISSKRKEWDIKLLLCDSLLAHSGKSTTIQELNHDLGVCNEHYAYHYVPKSSILLAGTGVYGKLVL